MIIATVMFYIFLAVAAAGTLALVLSRHVFHAALFLIVVLLALAGLYVLCFVPFLAITQIMIYAGGILVVMIFGIMLTSNITGKPLIVENSNYVPGILAGITLLAILVYSTGEAFQVDVVSGRAYEIGELGVALLTTHVLPFEIVGVVLLIALIGAAVVASSAPTKRQR